MAITRPLKIALSALDSQQVARLLWRRYKQMIQTKSEINTATLFRSIEIDFQKIDVEKNKTPDYLVEKNGIKIYVEVKEINENDDEIAIRKMAEGDNPEIYTTDQSGKRFRSKIKEANSQLKEKCKAGEPGIVIIQDLRPLYTLSLNPQEEIKLAMFGDRELWCYVHPRHMVGKVKDDIFTINRMTTERKNTTVSAVGFLVVHNETKKITMLLHHNPFAKNKLDYGILRSKSIKQYAISSTNQYGSFIEV